MAFEETRLNDKNSYGFVGTPTFRERILDRPNGAERRDKRWAEARWYFRVPYRKVTPEIYDELYNAFLSLGGMHDGCRFRDYKDYKANMRSTAIADMPVQGIGTGAVQQLQLVKNYAFGSKGYIRKIYKPVTGTVQHYSNGVPIASTPVGALGIFSLTAPVGETITADFEFDVPVRFDSDGLDGSFDDWQTLSSDIVLVELKGVNL